MKATPLLAIAAALLVPAYAAPHQIPSAPPPPSDRAQVTILYDAFGRNPALRKDWDSRH